MTYSPFLLYFLGAKIPSTSFDCYCYLWSFYELYLYMLITGKNHFRIAGSRRGESISRGNGERERERKREKERERERERERELQYSCLFQ